MRRTLLSLFAVVLIAPVVLVLPTTPSAAVIAGSDPGQPTPYVVTPDDIGPVAQGHPDSQPCLMGSAAIAIPVLERTVVAVTCGMRGGGPQRVFATLLEADGTRSEPWALVGAADSAGLVVRDIAVDPQTGDVGMALGLPSAAGPPALGLAKYDATSQSWTALTPQAVAQGARAACVDPNFSGALELGALMSGGVLTVVAPFSREVTTSTPPFVTTGEVVVLRSGWSGSGCSPAFDVLPIETGLDLAPQTGDNGTVDLDVSQVPGAEGIVMTVNRPNGTTSWSDDTHDVLLVDPSDGSSTAVVDGAVGRAVAVDLVEDEAGSVAVVSRLVSGSASVLAVPLNGDEPAVVSGAQSAMGFVDPDPSFTDAGAIPVGQDKLSVVGRSAVVLHDSNRVAYAGVAAYGPPFDRPRTPTVRMAWHDAAQPGGLRVVEMPTSSLGDRVHWRIPDMTTVRVVVREGTPVLTSPCGLDTSARQWWCVSSWSEDTGWSSPEAVRFAVRPSWPVTGGPAPVLVAGVTAGGVRLVERDAIAPTVTLQREPLDPIAAGSTVSGSLVAIDDNDGPEVACRVVVDGSDVASSAIPPHDDVQYFPAAVTGEQTLTWTTPALAPGTHEVRGWCVDRAGNRSADQLLVLSVPLGSPGVPRSVSARPRPASAIVSWAAPTADPARAVASSFVVQVKAPRTNDVTSGCVSTSRWCRVTGLDNGVMYQVRVQSVSADGAGDTSPWRGVRPLGVPVPPKGLTVVWRSGGRAQVYWKPSSTASAPVQGYRVMVNGRLKGLAGSKTATSLVLDGQRQGVRYTFAVQAFNVMGRATATMSPRTRPIP